MAYTPEPWTVTKLNEDDYFDRYHISAVKDGKQVCPAIAHSKDDAYLIGAAPDLLEALQQIAKGEGPFDRDPLKHAKNIIEDMKNVASNAIAKATKDT